MAKADTCRWVGATTRKDGKKVKAYCRKLPTRASKAKKSTKAAAPATPAQPTAKSTTTAKTMKKVAKKPAAANKAKAPPASAN